MDEHEPHSTRPWGGLRAAVRAMCVPSVTNPDRNAQRATEPVSSGLDEVPPAIAARRSIDDIRVRLTALAPVNRRRRTNAQLAEVSQRLTRIESMLIDLAEQTEQAIVAGQRESQDRTLQLITGTLPQVIADQLAQQPSPVDTDTNTGHGPR